MQPTSVRANDGQVYHRIGDVVQPRTIPDDDDVIVWQKGVDPKTAYLLGTPSIPNILTVHSRDEAVWQAFLYAEQHHVRAWYAKDDNAIVLLGTFRKGKKVSDTSEVILMAKSAKRTKAGAVSTPADRTPESPPDRASHVERTDIARRAYQLYEERGRADGGDVDDWLRAEEELRRAVVRGH